MACRSCLSVTLVSALLATAGCRTPPSIAEFQQRAPRGIYKTTKAPEAVAQCLIENHKLGTPSSYKRDDGATVVQFSVDGDTLATFVITPGVVEVRTALKITPFRKRTEACL